MNHMGCIPCHHLPGVGFRCPGFPGGERGVSAVDVEGEEGAGDDDDVGDEGVRQEGREAPPPHRLHPQAAVVG